MPSEKLMGKIKFFSRKGLYGFINLNDGREIYFREQDVARGVTSLEAGDPVEFTIVSSMRGPRGVSIRKVEP
jgi:cold shock CspA family protein